MQATKVCRITVLPVLLSGLTAAVSLAGGIVAIGSLGFVAAWMFWRWLPHRSPLSH